MSTPSRAVGPVAKAFMFASVFAGTTAGAAVHVASGAPSSDRRLAQTRGRASVGSTSASTVAFRIRPANASELPNAFDVPTDWITEDPRLNRLIPRVRMAGAIDQWTAVAGAALHCYRVFAAASDLPIDVLRAQVTNLGGAIDLARGADTHGRIGSSDISTGVTIGRTDFQICVRVAQARLRLAARAVPLAGHVRGLVELLGVPMFVQYAREGGPGPFGTSMALESTTMHFPTSPAVWRRAADWLRGHGFQAQPYILFTALADGIEFEVQNREDSDIMVIARRELGGRL